MHLMIPHIDHEVVITAESPDLPRFEPHSADNACAPEAEYLFGDDGCCPSSRHRISVRHGGAILASRVLLSTGGGSGVHAQSAFVRGDTCFVAVGPFVCALELPTLRLLWHTRADTATCFGIHDAPGHASIISHGEIEIARLDYSGRLLWSESGRDIFTGGFELYEHYAEAVDFKGTRYRFDLETGRSHIVTMNTSTTRLVQHVKAPRGAVYRALLDAQAVAIWMVPTGMTSHVHEFEPREGGSFRISLTYDEPTGTGKTTEHTDTYHGRFLKLVPDRQVVEVMEFETADPSMQGEMTVTFTLSDADGGTDVLAVHENVPSGVAPADNEMGWRMSLEKLASYVEAGGTT